MDSDLLRPFVSVFAGTTVFPEFRDHGPVDHVPSGLYRFSSSNSRQAFWAFLRKCLLFTGSRHLAASDAICLISSDTQNFYFVPGRGVILKKMKYQFLEPVLFLFRHGSPSGPTLDAPLCSDISPIHSGDHRKLIPSANSRVESGRVFSLEGTWTMFKRRFM